MDNTPLNASTSDKSTNQFPRKELGFAVALSIFLIGFIWFLGNSPGKAVDMAGITRVAHAKIIEHYSDGNFEGLNNDVLRQIAFASVDHAPNEPINIKGIISYLTVHPTSDAKSFGLVWHHLSEGECRALIEQLGNYALEVDGVPVVQGHPPNCRDRRSSLKISKSEV